jgi:hypothetical protein
MPGGLATLSAADRGCWSTSRADWLDYYSGPQSPLLQGRNEWAEPLSGAVHGAGCAEFFHRNAIAAVVVFYVRHVGLDERQAATAAAFQVFFGRAVRDDVGVKARAFVLNLHPETFGAGFALDDDFFLRVEPVAVPHRVDQRLDECHFDREQIAVGPAEQLELRQDFTDARFVRAVLTGQTRVDGPAPRMFRHAVDFPPGGNLTDNNT